MTGEPGVKIDLEDALNFVDEMRAVDSDEGVANALMRLAVAYLERKKYNLAFEALDEAYYICNKLENHTGRAQVCLRLAEVAQARGEWQEAEERLEEALKVFKDEGQIAGQVSALERLGRLFVKTGRLPAAASRLEKAAALLAKSGDQVGRLLLTQQLAPVYRQKGVFAKALAAYEDLGRLAGEVGDTQRVALALVGAAACQAELGRLKQGIDTLRQAMGVFEGLGQKTRVSQVEAEVARLESAMATNRKLEESR